MRVRLRAGFYFLSRAAQEHHRAKDLFSKCRVDLRLLCSCLPDILPRGELRVPCRCGCVGSLLCAPDCFHYLCVSE